MKLLFDQNISYRITKKLSSYYPDCKHVSDCGLRDCDDAEIWNYARKNGFSIVTFDSDFYDISIISGHPPKIIWVRSGNLTTAEIVKLFTEKHEIVKKFLESPEYADNSCLELNS